MRSRDKSKNEHQDYKGDLSPMKEDRLLICSGWCANAEGHNNPGRSGIQNESTYLGTIWLPAISSQIEPKSFFVYSSLCDILPATGLLREENVNLVFAPRRAKELPYRHDWAAAIISAAGYAMANNLDLMFIEQDCIVYRLKRFLEFARVGNNSLCYGYGDNSSLYSNWAENSLIYCSWSLLDDFVRALVAIKDTSDGPVKIEERFHEKMMEVGPGEYFRPWPWGVGRIRPLPEPGEDAPFYAQQLSDDDLIFMASKLEGFRNE